MQTEEAARQTLTWSKTTIRIRCWAGLLWKGVKLQTWKDFGVWPLLLARPRRCLAIGVPSILVMGVMMMFAKSQSA